MEEQHVFLAFIIKYCQLAGFLSNLVSKKWKWVHFVYGVLTKTYLTFMFLLQLVQLMYFIEDTAELFQNLSLIVVYGEACIKILMFLGKRMHLLMKKVLIYEKDVANSADERVGVIYQRHTDFCTKALRCFAYILAVVVIVMCGTSLAQDLIHPLEELTYVKNGTIVYNKRPLAGSIWLPYDKYKYYYCTVMVGVFAGSYVCLYSLAVDGMIFAFMIFSYCRARILQHRLLNVKKPNEEGVLHVDQDEENRIDEVIKRCTIEHIELITFVQELNDCIKWFMMFDFIICSLQLALIGMWFVAVTKSEILIPLNYMMAVIAQLFLFYGLANMVTDECAKIGDAIYDSNWHECTTSQKRSLRLVMLRSQIPLHLTVGPFYAMLFETAVSICKGGYTYVTIILNFYGRDN